MRHTHKEKLLPFAIGLIALAGVVSARAQIAGEGFDYPDGTQLFGQSFNGGFGWGNSWSATGTAIATNTAGSLTYGTLPTSGGRVVMGHSAGWPATGGQTASSQRILPTSLTNMLGGVGGTIWISMLYQNLSTDNGGLSGFREAKLALFSGASTNASGSQVNGTEKLDIGSPNTYAAGASDTLSLFQGSIFVSSGIPTPRGAANPAVFFLLRLDIDATGAADTAYAWFNPSLLIAPTTATAISFTNADLSGVNALRLQAGNLNGSGTNAVFAADELRLGFSFEEAVGIPEPTVFALSAIGGLSLLMLARKRHFRK